MHYRLFRFYLFNFFVVCATSVPQASLSRWGGEWAGSGVGDGGPSGVLIPWLGLQRHPETSDGGEQMSGAV